MFGDLNPQKIALESFNSFKKALDLSVDVAPQNRAILDDLDKKQTLAQKEQQIKQEVSQLSGRGVETSFAFGKPMEYTPEKLSWTARNYDIDELYTELSDGTLYKNFETYTPGINNYEDKARNQSTGERLFNIGTKFVDTLATGVVGGTAGLIYSVPTAIKEGKLSALYDNEFMQALDLHQEKMAIDYKQFIQNEDKEDFFNWQLADDVSQGLAFTGGALLTEALWAYATGGYSLTTTGARMAMRVGKIADKAIDASRYIDDALRVAKIGKAETVVKPLMATNRTLQRYGRIGGAVGETANLTRSLFTGAGYEAGFEARAYMNEARRDFKKQFKAQNGVDPTEEELKEFENNLASTANGLYAYNLAIVGTSNLAQFGSLMKLRLPDFGISKAINKRLFGVGTEIVENAPRALVATGRQRAAQIGWSLSKGALVEGAWEEGMQSVGNNTAMNLIKQTYDPKVAKENYGLVEASMRGFAETYGTKDGLHEVAVGMIVGAITGNALGIYKNKTLAHEFKNANDRNRLIEETFGKESTYTANTAINNMIMANRVAVSKKAEQQAERKGDLLGGQLARGGALYAQFQRGKALDFLDEQTEMLSNSIDLIDSAELAKEQGISLEQTNNLKESMKVELAKEKERFDRISQFTDVFISSNQRESDFQEFFEQYKKKNEGVDEKVLKKQFTSVMKEALNYELYLGELSYEHADEMLGAFKNELQTLLGSDKIRKSVDIHDIINKSKKSTQRQLNTNKKELEKTNDELNSIESQIRNLETVVNKATSPEQRQASLNSLNDLTVRRTELSEKVISLTRDFNVLKNSAKLESKFGERATNEELSTEEILSLEKDINKTLETIQQLKESDLEKANRLEKLLREYEKSVIAYKKYTERTNQMMNVGQGLGGKRGILAKMVLDSNPNQATKDMIKGLLDTHYEKSQYNPDDISDTIQNLTSKEEESQEEGVSMNPVDLNNISDKITELNKERDLELSRVSPLTVNILDEDAVSNVLSDDDYYITHITSDNNAVNIYNSSLNMSAGVSSTTGIVTKQGLIDLINNLEKGISPHRGYLDLFIGKIDKSTLDSENGRTLQDKLENYLDNNFIEDVAKTQLPTSFNFGYYSNGNIYIKDESVKIDEGTIDKKIKLYEDIIEKLKQELDNSERETDIEVDSFAKEMNNGNLEYQKVSFQSSDAIIYQTSQNNNWSGTGSSFRKTWDVLKFNQSFANNPVYSHVRILLTPEQKANYDKNSKTGFSKELRELAKKYRGSNVVLIDARPNRGDNKKVIESKIDSKLKEINILKNKLNISEKTKKINISKQENILDKEKINKINFKYDEKIAKLTGRNNLLKYIKQIIKDNPYLFEQVGGNVEDTLPTDEELIEYIELYSPVLDNPDFNSTEFTYNTNEQTDLFKKYLSSEEIDRLKELNTKFANWQLIESIGSEGISLADLIQQEALSRQEVRKAETEADVNETVLETASKEVDENGERRFDILQTVENVFIVDNKTRTHKLISHMTPKKFFELIGETGQLEVVYYDNEGKQIGKPVKTSVENINSVIKPNSKIHFGNSFIDITRGMRIKYRNNLGINLNTRTTKSGYSLVFDSDGNAMLSDFQDVNTYSPQEIFGIKSGDELELRVEENDFNLSLTEDELLDNLQISIYRDGNKVGDLKANYGEGEKSKFLEIRQKAKNIFTDTDTQTIGFVKASNVFLGTPNLKLGENGTEKLFDVVEEAVKDYGYWDGSKLDLKNNSKPRTDLLRDVKTNTPVIVIEENGMPIAYPAVLKVEDKNLGTEILNKGLSKGQLVLELNKALKENGIETNLYYISDENTNMFELDGKTSALLEDYIAKLDRVQDKADFKDDLSKLQVNIDLSGNRFFLSPKLAVDLNSFKEVANVQTQETVSEDVLKLHNYKNELVTLGNKKQTSLLNKQAVKINDDTLRIEGVTKKFIQDGGDVYVYSETNKSHVKWANDYKSGVVQALDLIKTKFTKYQESELFREYNRIQAEIDNLERDFLTKAEYEDYLNQLKRKEDSEEGKKCKKGG